MTELFDPTALDDLRLLPTLLNLLLVLLLGQLLTAHYARFSRVLSNKAKFGRVFVFIAATTMMMITVVKTSLALSLGLVGALSIVRFRTPIKEPEELAYLFLALAVGIGLGADQRLATVLMFLIILAFLALRDRYLEASIPLRTYVAVDAPTTDGIEEPFQRLVETARSVAGGVDLRRLDAQADSLHVSFIADLDSPEKSAQLVTALQSALPGATVSIVEATSLD